MTTAANSLTYRHWSDVASCRGEDPELFYPEGDQPDKEARRICLTRPVREQCLEHALKHDERFGIWGGLPAKERQQVKGRMARGTERRPLFDATEGHRRPPGNGL
jgi:WhiB family transcriptional regulator, redox-sensing transcriptional regulator